ncbi:hypothetical protein [Celerinatantimonas sp. MCCC 1A17872]|uniref:hypothetical protein n=1 Tax=Celerinatantimonas sp. MCCC 1A17872 TaxID=3177514 RepID=UPI0038C5D6E5
MVITLNTIEDVERLPSVLDIEEVSRLLLELIPLLQHSSLSPAQGADMIDELLFAQAYNETGITIEASHAVLAWLQTVYDPTDEAFIDACASNLANLTCPAAEAFIQQRLASSDNAFECQQLKEALAEIKVR